MTESTRGEPVAFTGCRPVLPVGDMAASLDYYCRVLGFREDWRWSDGTANAGDDDTPSFVYVLRGDFELFLATRPAPIQPVEIVVGLASTEAVDRLNEEYAASGAVVEEPATARPWGTYEMRVRDPDRHLLRLLTNLPDDG